MQQLSLFLPGFDFQEVIKVGQKTGSAKDLDEDLFGLDDEPKAIGQSISKPTVALLSPEDDCVEVHAPSETFDAVDLQQHAAAGTQSTEVAHATAEELIAPQLSAVVRANVISREAAPWPRLRHEDICDVRGSVMKFEANVAAIKLLRELQSHGREPSLDERLVLQRYTGWGGLKDAIEGYQPGWAERRDVLRDLLTEAEFRSARDSVLNAHYTDISVVDQVWGIVQRMGFKGGRIIDPAAGTGHFWGAMPEEIARTSDLYAVEVDAVSAGIHKALYGCASRTDHMGFEDVDYPQGWFDLAITNVPFGNYALPCKARKSYSRLAIHNYFLAKSLELVRPGGMVAIITSTYTLDARDEARRRWMRGQAELLGAIRMPSGTFSRIANTDVTTDLLLFRRRRVGESPGASERDFVDLVEFPQEVVKGNIAASNRTKNGYWLKHPECVLGKWVSKHAYQAGWNLTVEMEEGQQFESLMAKAIEALPRDIYSAIIRDDHQPLVEISADSSALARTGRYVVQNGLIHRWNFGRLVKTDLKGNREARVMGLIRLRDQTRALLDAQNEVNATDEEISDMRAELNGMYDSFVKHWGWIYARGNRLAFSDDPDWPMLLALEHYDEENDKAEKAAIFTMRTTKPTSTPTKADTPENAAAISMAEFGHINPGYVAQLLSTTQQDALQQLRDVQQVFLDPETGFYKGRDEYLSGNVRKKLALAQKAGPDYESNVSALLEVIPPDIAPGDIDVRLGANWVTCEEYLGFIEHLAGKAAMKYAANMEVTYDAPTGAWAIINRLTDHAFESKWGTKDIHALTLMVESMNGRFAVCKDPEYTDSGVRYVVNVINTAAARERQAMMAEEFGRWLWSDPERSVKLARRYNDEHNAYVERRYDGSRLRLEGYSWYLPPSPHQLNAIARIMTGENVLLAHAVGAGKTLEMIAGSMELRRLKLRNKILHAVPNHMLLQTAGEFMRAYPNAKLLIARKEDFAKERRKEFIARVALGDWDSIIMTHSTFERIPADPELVQHLITEMLDGVSVALAEAKKNREGRTQVKQLVKMEKLWKAKLEKVNADWKKDDFFSMADLGVDTYMFDEAHLAKNLIRVTQMDRVAGLPNVDSQRAWDLFVKTRHMLARHGNRQRGTVLATGTPVANSMAELHTFQRFLQPITLREQNLENFDSWAAQYGRVVTSLEVAPDGSSFRMNERFAQFTNLPELMGTFRQVADIQTKEMLNLPTPPLVTGGPQTIVCKPD